VLSCVQLTLTDCADETVDVINTLLGVHHQLV
jgi:hypothetical protein